MTDDLTAQLAKALHQLDEPARLRLDLEFTTLACLKKAHHIAAWADGWCYRLDHPRGLTDFTPPGLETVPDGYLAILRDRFGQHGWCCDPDPWLAQWCRMLVESMVDELDRRTLRRANEDAQFQIIAAEENRVAREGRPAPDLRGLPSWSEISTPSADG